ncbi:hypothetical protein GQ42DRAFT_130309 [Ramicandelaber brevisporus]|nr:hypothetical protein GQ42DRAFT_130309 [Ramicandelaber brevisporus]
MLKKDRKNYYRPEDITSLYAQLSQTVYDLERLREEEHRDADDYVNRTDFVLDDVYQLFSLFYMALGKNREIPATYVQLVTIKQSLLLFQEHGVFTTDDLMPYKKRLNDIQSIVERTLAAAAAAVADSSDKLNLVARKLRFCQKLADSLMASAQINDPMMMDIHKRLIEIRRRFAAPTPNTQSANEELRQIQRALLEIDNMRMDGKFYAPDGSIPAGQAQIIGLLEQIFDEAHDVQAANDMVPEALRPIFVQLMDIKQNLERLLMTHRWTLRETDLWSYQVQLGEIRALRRNGKFYDTSGPKPVAPKEGQATLNFLLHKGYHLVYKLLSSSEPVSEALTPIHNQLRTLRTVLLAVKKYGGPFSRRDLYPYQLKLSSLDALRVDGKFVDEQGNVPEGQGIVLSLLNECHDIVMELSNNIE